MIKWILALSLVLSFLNIARTSHAAEVVERIVAIVNDQAVTLSDLKEFNKELNTNPLVDELLTEGKSVEELKSNPDLRLNYLVNSKVLDSLIKKKGLSVTSDRIEQELKKMAASNNLTRDQLIEALKSQGIKISEYQEFLRTRIERQGLIEQEVSSKIRISDEEVLSAYAKSGKEGSHNTFEYTLSHILLLPEQGNTEKALEQAKNALTELKSNKSSFSNLAKKYSEDPNYVEGGKLGTFRSGELLPEIEEAVSSLKEGGITGIIQSRAGYHIVKVDKKKLIPNPEFARLKEQIRSRLFEDAFKSYFASWLEKQKSEAFVRIN